MNGEPMLADGRTSDYRPAAPASDPATTGDQRLVGAGPGRPHPADMGHLRGYDVIPWRSIFDPDPAARIVAYSGDCAAAEAAHARQAGQRR